MQNQQPYGYYALCQDVFLLCRRGLWQREIIGYSSCGRAIWALCHGEGGVLIQAAHHANEWITSLLLMHWGRTLQPSQPITLVPMVNPDGVALVTGEIAPESRQWQRAARLAGSEPFPSGWKANLDGVDLNLNYPAGWQKAAEIKRGLGVCGPNARDWPGPCPLSEPETRAMAALSERGFDRSLSLHSQGGEIYWDYVGCAPACARTLAEQMAAVSGYAVATPPETASYAGYKDWFLLRFRRPAYTVEVGRGENPLPLTDLPQLEREVFPLLDVFYRGAE